jgi:dTDP-4-amino-4,6-dideoxygalactose transaminase
MDCDDFYNLDSEKTIDFIRGETVFRNGVSYNKRTGRRISGVIAVHIFGNAVYLDDLMPVCRDRQIRVIEDAAESLGTRYVRAPFAGKHTGTVGELGCLSFNGNKIITTGGGGMVLTNRPDYAEQARYLTTQAKDDKVRYIHNDVGYNFRLTNLQAALGVAQLEQLPDYLKRKQRNYHYYKNAVDRIPGLHLAETPPHAENNHWMYALQLDTSVYSRDREGLMKHLAAQNIQTRPIRSPIVAASTTKLKKPCACWIRRSIFRAACI